MEGWSEDQGIQPLEQYVTLPADPGAALWLTVLLLLDGYDDDDFNGITWGR